MGCSRKKITWVVTPGGCHECTSHAIDHDGYPSLWCRGVGRHMHRVLYEESKGVVLPTETVVRHTCDNRACINLDHLIPGTRRENSLDMVERGRCNTRRGETRSDAKLTSSQVREIRVASGSQYMLAKKYGVNQSTISCIKTGKKRVFD